MAGLGSAPLGHASKYIRTSAGQLPTLDLGTFVAQVEAFSTKALANTDKAVRKMVFEVFKRIVKRTPADTGRCRAGWQVGKVYSMTSELGGSPKYSTTSGKTGTKTHKLQGERFRRVSSISERGVGKFIGSMVKAGAGTFDKSGNTTIGKGSGFILGEMEVLDGIIGYIFNNVRYAIYLEGGRVYPSPPYGSPQAPNGMVRLTLSEFGSIANQVISSINVGGVNMKMIGV
jgi:hypothetical protein